LDLLVDHQTSFRHTGEWLLSMLSSVLAVTLQAYSSASLVRGRPALSTGCGSGSDVVAAAADDCGGSSQRHSKEGRGIAAGSLVILVSLRDLL
jgi:hypothetical protein